MMRNALLILMIAALLIACSGGGGSDFNQYKGTDGILVEFVNGAPPKEVYEAKPFPVKFMLRNAGAMDVNYSKVIVNFSYDPLYLRSPVGIYDPERYDAEKDFIAGKSINYPSGEERLFSIPTEQSFEANAVYGMREQPVTELRMSACYAYRTVASTLVCIDTNIYDENLRKETCKAKDVVLSGGQGAPIAVEKIEVAMLPVVSSDRRLESVQPEFRIHIRDVGNGYLVGPDTLPMGTACLLRGIPKEQVNSVLITAHLHDLQLDCGYNGENMIRLTDGTGEISCTVPDRELSNPVLLMKQNYETLLTINLSYIYKTSASTTIAIRRTGNADTELPSFNGKAIGYLYAGDEPVRDGAGNPITMCRYYAKNPTAAPPEIKGRVGSDFGCSCSSTRCLKIADDGKCVYGSNLCPPNQFCCNDQSATAGGYLYEVVLANPDQEIPSIGSGPSKQEINSMLDALSRKYGIPPDILKAIAYQESTWRCQLSGDGGKSYGMMQIYTVAHPDYNVERGKAECSYNAEFGAAFLASLYAKHNSWPTAVMRYNGAGDAAERYRDSVMKHAQEKPWEQWL